MEEAWTGPWEITCQCGPVIYEVKIGDRQKKITHLKALKKFEERDVQVKRLTVLSDPDTPEEEVDAIGGPGRIEGHGTCEGFDQQQLDDLLKKHSNTLTAEPGLTNLAEFRIDTEDAQPICQFLYRPPERLLAKIEQEIEMLKNKGIIEDSPIIPVGKSNGEIRICVDYRKLNVKTKQKPSTCQQLRRS